MTYIYQIVQHSECVYLLLFRRHNCKFLYYKLRGGSSSGYIIHHRPWTMIANVTYFCFFNGRLTKSYNTITIRKLLLHAHLLLLRLLYILYFYFMIAGGQGAANYIHAVAFTICNTYLYIYIYINTLLNVNRPWIYLFPYYIIIHCVLHRRKNCKWPLHIIITTPQKS